jgi:cytochrome c oxidase subunit 3
MRMSRSLFDATFFILTSFHGLHVFCGVVYLLSVLAKAKKYTQENYTHVEVAGLYWHFVDLVWIILFTLVYLI